MKKLEIIPGSRVAYSTNKAKTVFKTGYVSDLKNGKALVKFDKHPARWVKIENLELLNKTHENTLD